MDFQPLRSTDDGAPLVDQSVELDQSHYRDTAFLELYFALVYVLQCSVQLACVVVSVIAIVDQGVEVSEPEWLITVDIAVVSLMWIEICSLLSVQRASFWRRSAVGHYLDVFVGIISIAAIVIHFTLSDDVSHSKEIALALHVTRDACRIVRIPVFINHLRCVLSQKSASPMVL